MDRLILSAKRHYFKHSKFIDQTAALTIWARLDTAMSSLTRKQRPALEIYLMEEAPESLEATASRLKISKAAFRDRVKSAIKQIEAALPELVAVKPEKKRAPRRRPVEQPRPLVPRKDAPPRGHARRRARPNLCRTKMVGMGFDF